MWFNSVDVNSFFPECFDLSNQEDIDEFKLHFKVNKAESILKRYVEGEQFSQEILAVAMKVAERRLMTLDEIVDNPKCFDSLVSDKEWEVIGYDELSASEWVKKTYDNWMVKNHAKSPRFIGGSTQKKKSGKGIAIENEKSPIKKPVMDNKMATEEEI